VADRVLRARVQLLDPRHLFVAAHDPFCDDYRESGTLERLANELYARRDCRSVHVTLGLPAECITPTTTQQIIAAVHRYCDRTIDELDRTRVGERSRGLRALVLGIAALIVAVIVNRGLRDETSYWLVLLTEGVTVAFWVAIWFPTDSLVFGQWQHRIDRRIYATLRELELDVVPFAREPDRQGTSLGTTP
jgi:hypothetical protein